MPINFATFTLLSALFTLGLYAGGCLYITVVEIPALRTVSTQEYLHVFKMILPRAGLLMLPLLLGTVIFMAAYYWYGQTQFNVLVVIAMGLIGLVFAATFMGNVPLNRVLLAESPIDLQRWITLIRQWEAWHLLRTLCACAAFVLLAVSIVFRT